MAKKPQALLSFVMNARNRTLVFVVGVLLVISVVYALTQFSKSSSSPLSGEGSVAAAAPQIKSVPGGIAPEKYIELQKQESEQKATEAIKQKTASIPTIIGAVKEDTPNLGNINVPQFSAGIAGDQPQLPSGSIQLGEPEMGSLLGAAPLTEQSLREKRQSELDRRRLEREAEIAKAQQEQKAQQEAAQAQKQAEQDAKAYQASVQKIQTSMRSYAGSAYKEWSVYSKQEFKSGKWEKEEYTPKIARLLEGTQEGKTITAVTDENGNPQAILVSDKKATKEPAKDIIKAGTILFAVLDTGINTDEPSPVLATIVHGKYKGGKLIGKIEFQPRQEKVLVSFDTLSLPTHPTSLGISAYAVDPNTARTALASEVNKHYLLRYGTLFASSFMEGYSKAISEQGTVTSTPNAASGTGTTTTTKPELSGQEEIMTALGAVGKKWGDQMKPIFSRPYTVTVKQGTGIGLLFISDADVTLKE